LHDMCVDLYKKARLQGCIPPQPSQKLILNNRHNIRNSIEIIKSRNKNIISKANIAEKSITIPGPPKGERCMTLRMGARKGSVNLYT
jgi:hypothetical protein